MKNLITTIACVTILLVFVLQFASSQITYNHISSVDKSVNSFKEVAKQEGCVTSLNADTLKKRLAVILECNESEISISGTSNKVMRGGEIHYKVSVPMNNLVAASSFWNMTAEENRTEYVIDNYTTSEYIGRL